MISVKTENLGLVSLPQKGLHSHLRHAQKQNLVICGGIQKTGSKEESSTHGEQPE